MQKVVYELESTVAVRWRSGNVSTRREGDQMEAKVPDATKHLLLKGQMKYAPELDAIAFLCTPL